MAFKSFSQSELYYGFNKKTFASQANGIGISNLRVLKNLSVAIYFTAAVEAIILRVLSSSFSLKVTINLITAAVSLFVFFLCRKTIDTKTLSKPRTVNLLIFFTSLFYYLVAAYSDTLISPNNLAVKFIFMICIIQIVFIVPPPQNLFTTILSSAIFIAMSVYAKNSDLFAFDILSLFVSVALGAVMSFSISKIKIENLIFADKLKKSNYDLYHENITDSLTGLSNRKMTLDTLSELFDDKYTLTYLNCISLNIDFFREYNRYYGASSGDKLLVLLSGALNDYCQKKAFHIGRVGGGEFMVLFKSDSPNECEAVSADICKTVEELAIPNNCSAVSAVVTVSIGVFSDKTESYNSFYEIHTLSERALYRAKEDGGNKVWKYIPEINGFSLINEN